MFTKCPRCGKSDKVKCLNNLQRAAATACAGAAGAGLKAIFRQTNPTVMKEIFKTICPVEKFYCERCKEEFEVRH